MRGQRLLNQERLILTALVPEREDVGTRCERQVVVGHVSQRHKLHVGSALQRCLLVLLVVGQRAVVLLIALLIEVLGAVAHEELQLL